jgi:hypothetical protein
LATKIRKADSKVSLLIKVYQFFGEIFDFQDTKMINSGSKINTSSKPDLPINDIGMAIDLAQDQETLREQGLAKPVAGLPPPG